MRGNAPQYRLETPRTLADALAKLRAEPGRWRAFAGGTDLMVLLEAGQLKHADYLSLHRIDELKGLVREPSGAWVLGALTTYAEVLEHPELARTFPNLAAAARETGAWAIQNRGTLGGNLANASPAADSVPALLAYDAELELRSASGARWVPHAQFHTGYKTTVLKPDELIARIRLPAAGGNRFHFFRKVGTRRFQSISKVCLAARADLRGGRVIDARLAWGAVGPVTLRSAHLERSLAGLSAADLGDAKRRSALLSALAAEITPQSDVRSTRAYRLKVSENLLGEFLDGLVAFAAGKGGA
ncbi:MAG: FAD binding domain-containing protein [Bdellovibrionales bacterium]|nr:FAD binding domain-containing protein [Bdellovibrionales bacterium]